MPGDDWDGNGMLALATGLVLLFGCAGMVLGAINAPQQPPPAVAGWMQQK